METHALCSCFSFFKKINYRRFYIITAGMKLATKEIAGKQASQSCFFRVVGKGSFFGKSQFCQKNISSPQLKRCITTANNTKRLLNIFQFSPLVSHCSGFYTCHVMCSLLVVLTLLTKQRWKDRRIELRWKRLSYSRQRQKIMKNVRHDS